MSRAAKIRPGRLVRLSSARPALAALAVLLGACPGKPPVQRPYPPPDPAELAAVLAARHAAVRSMNARARVTSWLGGERVRATVLMLVERGGRLRVEAQVSLQGTVATLVTDDGRFALLDAQKNELRRGPACPANVASLVRIPLGPAEVAAILLGDVALDPVAGGGQSVEWDASRGADVWVVPGAAGTARLAFRGPPRDRALVGVSWQGADGARLWQTSYEDLAAGGGGPRLPNVIRFAEGSRSFDDGVEIRFQDRALDVTPRAQDFALAAPPGVTVREIGCGG